MRRSISAAAVLFLAGSMAMAADSTLNSKDTAFLKDAAMGAMTEVNVGKVAAQQGNSDAVKQFGQKMATDHGAELDELKTLAQSKGVDLPMDLDKKHQKMADKMSKMSGDDFDKAYSKNMLDDHKMDVKKFQKEADNAADPDVKAFAAKQLPTLKEHLELAEKLPGNSK